MVQQKLVSFEKSNDTIKSINEKIVPQIRFSEFSESWEKLPAGEIFKNVSNKKHDGTLPILAVTQDKGVVRRDDLDMDIITSEKSVKSYKIIEPGDFVISLRSFQGGIEYSYIEGICSPAYTILKPKREIYDDFYKFYLKKDEFISRLNYAVIGIRDGKQISYKDFSEIKIPYTNPAEQKKIANFLNDIDKKIELLEKKLVLYQKNIDFNINKIFSNINDFNEVRLKNIVKSYSSNLSINKLEENQGDYPLYGAEGIVKYVDFYEIETPYISIIKDGAGVGRLNLCEKLSSPLGTLQCLIPNDDIDINFLYFYLKTINFRKYIVGSTIPHIYYKDYSNEKINVPSLKNQQNIGNYFILLDKRNELIKREIKLLNKFKKGLLQKMFI